VDVVRVPGQDRRGLGRGVPEIPNHHLLPGVAGRQMSAVQGVKRHRPRTVAAAWPAQRNLLLAGGDIPENYLRVRAGAGHIPVVGAKPDPKSRTAVARERRQSFFYQGPVRALVHVPEPNLKWRRDTAGDE